MKERTRCPRCCLPKWSNYLRERGVIAQDACHREYMNGFPDHDVRIGLALATSQCNGRAIDRILATLTRIAPILLALALSCGGVSVDATPESETPYECPGATWWARTGDTLDCGCRPWVNGAFEYREWTMGTPDERRAQWLESVANGMCAW